MWYDHLEMLVEEGQEKEALTFLQQCVPFPNKYIIPGSSSLIACFQRLEELCSDDRIYPERTAAQRNPRSFSEDEAIRRKKI